MPKILIVGAGIAGDTLAVLLGRAGWSVTVVEIAPALRTGGQTVDLRGGSREVLDRLGLLGAALDVLVPQRGIAWIDARGRRLAEMPVDAFGGQGLVSEEELLRTDLARLLHGAAVDAGVHYTFADTVDELRDVDAGVSVRFRSGNTEAFDVVVGADGAHSHVRALRFGPEADFRRPLGLAHAWYTLAEKPSTPSLNGWALDHNAPGRRLVSARPGLPGHQQIGLTFAADELPARTDHQARIALLEREFAGMSWRTREFLDAARTAPDFALDTFDQVHMPTWFNGRVVLLGDAAWCASPLSGLGTALGLHGAAALADALGDGSSLGNDRARSEILANYEQTMRPRVVAAQKLIPGRVDMIAPKGKIGIRLNALIMRVAQWRILQLLVAKVSGGRGHTTEQGQLVK
ncbi:FAD-dependent monooxygenase [Arthrobacter cryoconiti]|uniref:FAD-dependent monooxygenase n=1 Tax=Arthrobacter cryoconiti TaxID=748907 RepID=A0ABV8R1Y0_9MICC|nr:FAD-dependent monooxygenase [Arthrobacter cryoconiti]MCC9067771.1 FAD-dependent monooxygenase [Arthrobacter cryoconiti]